MSIAAPDRGSFPATHPVAAMAMPLATRTSGVLTLRHGKVRHDIAFVEGRATGVDSNAVKESLPVVSDKSIVGPDERRTGISTSRSRSQLLAEAAMTSTKTRIPSEPRVRT